MCRHPFFCDARCRGTAAKLGNCERTARQTFELRIQPIVRRMSVDLLILVRSVTGQGRDHRSEEHTSELQSLMRISYAVFCLKKKKNNHLVTHIHLLLPLSQNISIRHTIYYTHECTFPTNLQHSYQS